MKIQIITPALCGGGWNSFKRFIENYPDKNVKWIVSGLKSKAENLPEVSQIKYFTLPFLNYDYYVHKIESNIILMIFFNLPLFLISLISILIEKPDIVIGNGLFAGVIGLVSKIFKAKCYTWIHTDLRFSERNLFLKKVILYFLTKFNHIFVNSLDVKDDLLRLSIPENKITIIPNWVDNIYFKEKDICKLRAKYGYSIDDYIILFVGRFVKYKHFLTYLEVVKLSPINIKFIFVGRGEFENEIKNILKKYKNVKYLGFISDTEILSEIYAIANFLISWADETYMPLVALESLASGTPVIYPDISSAPSKYFKKVKISNNILPEGIGWKISCNPEIISKFLIKMQDNKKYFNEIREKCKVYASKYHSSENVNIIRKIILKFNGD